MSRRVRILAVEDTYGAGLHRSLVEWAFRRGEIRCGSGGPWRPRIERMPAKKCNHMLVRKLLGMVAASAGLAGDWRVLVVIDSEGLEPRAAAEREVLGHVRKHARQMGSRARGALLERFRVAVVVPSHEAWACIALGGGGRCRDKEGAVEYLERVLGRAYEKRDLERLPGRRGFDPGRLLGEEDFRGYLEGLRWLLC